MNRRQQAAITVLFFIVRILNPTEKQIDISVLQNEIKKILNEAEDATP